MKKQLENIHNILEIYQLNDSNLDFLIAVMYNLVEMKQWELLRDYMYFFIDLSAKSLMCSELDDCFNKFWEELDKELTGVF